MYGFPADLDLGTPIREDLNQMCLGRYDLQLVFGEAGVIAVTGAVEVLDQTGAVATWNEGSNWSSLTFQRLLNDRLAGLAVRSDRVLDLALASGLTVRLHDSERFESVTISTPGRCLVV